MPGTAGDRQQYTAPAHSYAPAEHHESVPLARGAHDTDLPIDLTWARDYERDVLFAAMRIPWGETRPYRWLAREARRPLAELLLAEFVESHPQNHELARQEIGFRQVVK